jgi:hypothetical protein
MRSEVVMPRKSPNLKLEEIPGNQYQNLEDAQSAALKATAADLAETMRALLESGVLIVENGKAVPDHIINIRRRKNRPSTG